MAYNKLTINAILLQNLLMLETQSCTFLWSTKQAKRSLPYFQDLSNIKKKIEQNNKILVTKQTPKQ